MRGFRILTVITVLTTVLMIAVGSTVRATGSGLGCPDWPLCYGGILPPLEFSAIIEWIHRVIASVISVLVVLIVIGAFLTRRAAPTIWRFSVVALALLLGQAILGGVTVLTGNAPWTVWLHLVAALTFLANVTMIAALASLGPGRSRITGADRAAFIRTAMMTTVIMAVVLAIGAYTVATDAGFACTTWPSCREGQIPFLNGGRLQHIQWVHRFTVAGGFVVVAWLFLHVREMRDRGPMLQRGAHALLGLYGVQIVVGGLNPLTGFAQSIRVAHLAVAAIIWVVMILMWYAGRYRPGIEPPPAGARDAETNSGTHA